MPSLLRLAQRSRRKLPLPQLRAIALTVALAVLGIIVPMFTIDVPSIVAARQLPAGVIAVFRELTDFANSAWFLWPLGILIAALGVAALVRPQARSTIEGPLEKLVFLFLVIALTRMSAYYGKYLFGRGRPFVGGEANAFVYDPFNPHPAYASLPSGHAVTAFAVLAAFGMLWPRLYPALWVYAIVMGLCRVIITAHHPSDVVAGALWGVAGALLFRRIFAARDLAFEVHRTKIVAKPGPGWATLRNALAKN
ncbi:MAG: phosphatase PAP2 family protein [Pseudolabrys sp.]|nr:phosphatase PAP2 family protein [Pseudolabrys sp.]MBV9956557.1 phosphatase PAP2 family protein [Pseudolabrys sp.]